MKKAIDFFTTHPARFFLLAALLWCGFMCFLNYKDGANFSWHDLLVEANGMVFDLLVFGILLSIYEALREKRDKIERLHEEIDDYRGWNEKEATFRIVGAVRLLNKLGITKVDLSSCFLEKANLKGVVLHEASLFEVKLAEADLAPAFLHEAFLMRADLSRADLREINLQGASLSEANLEMANLRAAFLIETNLERANLTEANLREAFIIRANLRGTNFNRAKLQGAKLQGSFVNKDWFEELEKWEVEGFEEIKTKYFLEEYKDRFNFSGWMLKEKQ